MELGPFARLAQSRSGPADILQILLAMLSQFALPQRINFAQTGTVRAYFLRSILKFDMSTATPRLRSSCAQVISTILLLTVAFFFPASARSQTILGSTNKVAFAKPVEVCM